MSTINAKDYDNKDEFWQAVSSEIRVSDSRPSPSGYHRFSGKIYLVEGKILEFSKSREILSYIGKNYYKSPIEYVEIMFNLSPYGRRPKLAPRPKPWK